MASPLLDAPIRRLPEPLARLPILALDLHWSWNHTGDVLWKQLDETVWERTGNPWLVLQYVAAERLEALAEDATFLRNLQALEEARLRYHAEAPRPPEGAPALPLVAYFSMEFGLHEALPLYAGGLGVLAGDHLKTASDLDVPVLGIGILWQQGYFRQVLDPRGRQEELYPFNDPASLPVQPVIGSSGERLRVALSFPDRIILLRAWQVTVGRTRLYLLDSNDPLNAPADRGLTSALYGGGSEVRLMQDVILGVGGWRLLKALGLAIEVCHLNEGHAAFVVLERARDFMEQHGVAFRQALWATRAGNVFTTHTAVADGFDVFQPHELDLHRAYFEEYVGRLGLTWPDLLALGRRNSDDEREPFNMAWLALRGCSWTNAVSRLHGAVSRRLFAGLFPRRPDHEVPVGHITNGIHVPSWDSPWADALWTHAAGKPRWRGDVAALTDAVLGMSDEDLWSVRAHERADLVHYARERLARQLARRGRSLAEATAVVRHVLDPDALTLGFARRFAAYKRPNLLLLDADRLLRLLTNARRPVQLIVAGKAHPQNNEGKDLIQQWVQFASHPAARARVVFIDDYDMRLATELAQGVDVWINTPRRPWEASGTSGMKVLANGGLNLSSLDGWWSEAFRPECGWALGDGLEHPAGEWDARDAEQLYALLEDEIVPLFYERDAEGLPRGWIQRMRSSMATLAPRFSSVRMLQEYVSHAYVPAAETFRQRAAEGARMAKVLDLWSRHLEEHWSAIRFGDLVAEQHDGQLSLSVAVYLGHIEPDSVRVELYAEADHDGAPFVQQMEPVETIASEPNASRYRALVGTERPVSHFTPRVVPFHLAARVPAETPLVRWQR
jgi:glycogen phosphorylase